MQLPKLKTRSSLKLTLSMGLTLAALLILILEAYYAWTYLYNNLISSQQMVTDSGKVVRLNNATYTDTVDMLKARLNFTPDNPTPTNPNPFR